MWFNYLWIVMLGMITGGFISYTIVCFYSSYHKVLEVRGYCDCFIDECFKEETSLTRKQMSFIQIFPMVWEDFTWRHEGLCLIWKWLLILIAIVIFIVSLICWLDYIASQKCTL